MSWAPELVIGELRPWPESVKVVRGNSGEAMRYDRAERSNDGVERSDDGVAVTVAPDDYTAKLMTELVQVMEERDTLRSKFEVSQGMRHDEHERHVKESASLRDRITTQKQTVQAYRDESREWREVAERAQAENDKLREELAKARDPQRIGGQADPSSFVYAIEQLREFRWQHATNDEDAIPYINNVAAAHERENDKLRELVSVMAYCMQCERECDGCRLNDADGTITAPVGCDGLLDRMRELGIEVDA